MFTKSSRPPDNLCRSFFSGRLPMTCTVFAPKQPAALITYPKFPSHLKFTVARLIGKVLLLFNFLLYLSLRVSSLCVCMIPPLFYCGHKYSSSFSKQYNAKHVKYSFLVSEHSLAVKHALELIFKQ